MKYRVQELDRDLNNLVGMRIDIIGRKRAAQKGIDGTLARAQTLFEAEIWRETMTRQECKIRGAEKTTEIIQEEIRGHGDKDINNLKLIMYSIMPGSYWWRRGMIRTLGKAIDLMRREKEANNED